MDLFRITARKKAGEDKEQRDGDAKEGSKKKPPGHQLPIPGRI